MMEVILLKKMICVFSISLLCLSIFLITPKTSNATTSSYSNSDLLYCWMVGGGGYIFTPVTLEAKVTTDFTVDYLGGTKSVTRWDSNGSVLKTSYDTYLGTLQPGQLNIRGTNHSLPNTSYYIDDPQYVTKGLNWVGSEVYSSSSASCYGQAIFIVNSSRGYQLSNTTKVDFSF